MSVDTPTPTLLGQPDLKAAMAAFAEFCTTVAWLRDPQNGCPWDLQQDHQSLRRFMIEEAYEAADAMQAGDTAELRDELGDVLLQVVLNAQVAKDQGQFSIVDVVQAINSKMRRRHPHVFQTQDATVSVDAVRSNWETIKASEKGAAASLPKSYMAEAEKKNPATLQAQKIGKLAAKIRFDWDHPQEVFQQLRSEIDELEAELKRVQLDRDATLAEIGDVYFSLAQLCRHLDIDPELAALEGNKKFLRRFAQMEQIAAQQQIEVAGAKREILESLWQAAKRQEDRK